jgi:Predicted Fe-S oxidoreductases
MDHSNKGLSERIHQKEESEISLCPSFQGCRMSIEVTNACNHHCVFCPSGNLNRKRQFINEDLFYRLIAEGYELGVRELALHMLGEPLLNENLPQYIAKAKSLGYSYVYLTTNGSLATPEKMKEIFEAGLDSIKFSINAISKENYLAVHGRDDFDTVKNNLICCSEYRKKSGKKFNIFISFVVTDQTTEELSQFKKVFSQYADDIAFMRVINRGGEAPESINSFQGKVSLSDEQINGRLCRQPFNAICVTCEGILAPCCMDGDLIFKMADLHNTSLRDAWHSEKMTDFRRMHIEKTFYGTHCESCLRSGSNWINVLEIS